MEHLPEHQTEKDKKDPVEMGKPPHHRNLDREIKALIATISALALAAVIFFAGMVVGRLQDRFVIRRVTGESMLMGGSSSTMMPSPYATPGMLGQGNSNGGKFFFANSNGIKGTITSVSGNNVSIKGANGTSESITITPDTIIKNGSQDITISDLKKGDQATVIGDPDAQGGITAKFIGVQQ